MSKLLSSIATLFWIIAGACNKLSSLLTTIQVRILIKITLSIDIQHAGLHIRNIFPFILDTHHGLEIHLNFKKKIKKLAMFILKIELFTLICRLKMSIDM